MKTEDDIRQEVGVALIECKAGKRTVDSVLDIIDAAAHDNVAGTYRVIGENRDYLQTISVSQRAIDVWTYVFEAMRNRPEWIGVRQ